MFATRPALIIAASFVLSGCANSTFPDALVTVTGMVTHIDDQVPADGGVAITLALDGGGTELLLFGSLFTSPPPSEERLELYQKIRTVEVGSHVRATGLKRDGGIELTDIMVLEV